MGPGSAAEFAVVSREFLDVMRGAPGALWAQLLSDGSDAFVLLSEWTAAADADAWESGDLARDFARRLDPLLAADRTLRRFEANGSPFK